MPATFREIGLLKRAYFHRRIHEPVIILGLEFPLRSPLQCGSDLPISRHIPDVQHRRRGPGIHRVHENLSQIKKRVR